MQRPSVNIRSENPKAEANYLSQLLFCYTLPIFRHGWSYGFTEDDLYEVMPEYRSKVLGDQLERAWERELMSKRRPSLLRVLCKIHLRKFINFCLVLIAVQLIRMCQAVALFYLMKYFEEGQTDLTINHAYICAVFIALPSFVVFICMHNFMLNLQRLGMKTRIACCSLVYRKSLKLSRKAIEDATVGQMVNLLSNDVNRFDLVCLHLPYLVDITVEVPIILALLYYFTTLHPFAGVALFVISVPVQIILGSTFSKIRSNTAIRTDERVRLMNEILSGIHVIKMHTWEQSFEQLVNEARRQEIKQIRWSCYVKSLLLSLTIITSRVATFIALLVYVNDGLQLNAPFVFLIVGLFGMLRQSMTIALPNAITQIAETRVTIRRLEAFLLSENMWRPELESSVDWIEADSEVSEDVRISLTNVSAKWTPSNSENALTNITFELQRGDLMAVIGVVGSGKSSLLNLLLKELPITSGKLNVVGVISYAAQEPWLFMGTIRQNILFGQEYNLGRYDKVLTVCALKPDLHILPFGDDTIIGERGVSLSGGQRARVNLARAIYMEADIYLLDDPLSAVDTKVGNIIFESCIMEFLAGKCVILATHQLQYLRDIPQIMILQEGKISFLGDYEAMVQEKPELVSRMEEKVDANVKPTTTNVPYPPEMYMSRPMVNLQKEAIDSGAVKRKIYVTYMRACGNGFWILIVVILFLATQILASASDFFISFWVNVETLRVTGASNVDEFGYDLLSTNDYVWVYTILIILTVVFCIVRSIAFFTMCMHASIVLHRRMFNAVIYAPMSFFSKQPFGRILNRFSKDIGTIDDQFPYVTLDTFQIGLSVLGVTVVTVVVNPFILIPMLIILVMFYFIRKYYLHTSRNIKRLEAVTRSPVFTHINATIHGMSTIRAFKAETNSRLEFDAYQDIHSSAWDIFLDTSRAFGFVLDLICCIYIAIVVFSFLTFFTDFYGASVGLAITQSLMLTGMFQWGMRQWSEMDNNMTSVERVYEYTQITPEKSSKPVKKPPPYWPLTGAIEFKHVYLKYGDGEPYVLRDLSFKVKPNQKIGIVGRTGAGKSSIIASLFQLATTEGQIIIDNIDIHTIPLKDLRQKIAIIPQEPVLFAGTLRKNLDPFQEHSDELLWKALEDVAMLGPVLQLPSGLESTISEGGANFSVGQRQLLCLARAIVRSNRILVLDEATASVDPLTDELIQTTIKTKFHYCTVLTIAHRLHTILDSDKVLVMEAGQAMEFGYSYVLLQNPNGFFYSLVQSAGPRLREEIFEIARQNYQLRMEKGIRNPPKPLEPEDTIIPSDRINDSKGPSGTSGVRDLYPSSQLDDTAGASTSQVTPKPLEPEDTINSDETKDAKDTAKGSTNEANKPNNDNNDDGSNDTGSK